MKVKPKCMKSVFYSYKGGVGRTTSLVNVAYQLAKMGKSVLIIDFDFGAPGVTLFDELRPRLFDMDISDCETYLERKKIPDDLRKRLDEAGYSLSDNYSIAKVNAWRIDQNEKVWQIADMANDEYFYAFKKESRLIIERDYRGILEFLTDMLLKRPSRPVEDYIYEIEKGDEFDGPIHIMRVSRAKNFGDLKTTIEDYKRAILDLKILPNLGGRINDMEDPPDYMLIDSRPGRDYIMILETVGMMLEEGDSFVICDNYNKNIIEATYNNIEVLKDFLQKKHNITGLKFHPILTQRPVDLLAGMENIKYGKMIESIEKRVPEWKLFNTPGDVSGKAVVTIRFNPDMMFEYIIAKEVHPGHVDYKKLAMRIISFNLDDIINKMKNAKKGEMDEVIGNFNSLKNNPAYENEYQLYFELGKVLFERGKRYKEASNEFETAYRLTEDKGGHPDIALWLGRTYYHLYSSEKKEEHINESIKWFETADKIKRHPSYELYHEWSKALIERSRISEKKEDKLRPLKTAENTIESAITIRQDWEPFETKGVILTEESALTETNEEKIKILKEANSALSESKIRGGKFDTHYIWARNLYDIAIMTADLEKRTDALKRCDRLFESAMEIQEEDAEVYYWWGIALALSASSKTGERRRILLVRASEKLSTAVNIRQNYKKAHFYLGAVLFMLEKNVDEEQKPLYFRDAFYGMEWTVSLDEPDLSGFYFEDVQIQEFEKDTYTFVRTLENRYGYEPLFEEWVGKQDISEKYIEILDGAINEYRAGADVEVN